MKNRRRYFVIFTAFWVTNLSCATLERSHAQIVRAVPEFRVERPPFRESVRHVIPTSAETVIGVQIGGLVNSVDRPNITIAGIRPRDQTICVNIEHSSGSYLASFRVGNPLAGSTVRFELPSTILRSLGARTGELAILARASQGSDCGTSSSVLRAGWGRLSPSATGYVLINDSQADIARIIVDGRPAQRCVLLRSILGQRAVFTSFQTACPLPQNSLECASERRVTIQLLKDGEFDTHRLLLRDGC